MNLIKRRSYIRPVLLALALTTGLYAQASYAGNTTVAINLYNCIPGKTLYPRIFSIHMSETIQNGKKIAIQGPAANAPIGTCSGVTALVPQTADGGGGIPDISGVVVITGLGGSTLIYNENQYYAGSYDGNPNMTFANGSDVPHLSQHFWIEHAGTLGVVSNANGSYLPPGVSCPAGSSRQGSACMTQSYAYDLGAAQPQLTYTVWIYPPATTRAQDDWLPQMPSK